jgi:colicin import membrane protein
MRYLSWLFSLFLHLTVILGAILLSNLDMRTIRLDVPVYEVDLYDLRTPGPAEKPEAKPGWEGQGQEQTPSQPTPPSPKTDTPAPVPEPAKPDQAAIKAQEEVQKKAAEQAAQQKAAADEAAKKAAELAAQQKAAEEAAKKAAAEQAAKKAAEEQAAKIAAEKAAREAADKAAKEAADKAAKEAADKAAKEAADKAAKDKAAKETADKAAKEAADKAAKEAADKAAKAAADKAAKERQDVLNQALKDAKAKSGQPQAGSNAVSSELAKLRQQVGQEGGGGGGGGGGGEASIQAYRDIVNKLVKQNWRFPQSSTLKLICQVELQIGTDGRISSSRVTQSSGRPDFDNSALRAVEETQTLPPPPRPTLNMITINFNSQEQR